MEDKNIILSDGLISEEIANVDIGEVIEVVNIDEAAPLVVEINEATSAINTNGDPMNHALLHNRELFNQHPIRAIEGLSEELDQIKSLKTVYSNKYNYANYYKWADGNNLNINRNNLFVSACIDENGDVSIDICDDKDVFGITVSDAAFVGGQEYIKTDNDSLIGRDASYNAVVNSGLVEVRCVEDVAIGDYVFPNKDGIATKSDGKYGYRVVDLCDIDGLPGVIIALLPSSKHDKYIAQNVDELSQRMTNTEYNIVGIRNLANEAYNLSTKQQDKHTVDTEKIKEDINEIFKELEDTLDVVGNINASFTNVSIDAAKAKQIANDAILSANKTRDEAIQTANDAWGKAEEVKESINSLTAKIAEYTIGEYSQAYGLTHSQVIKILKNEMVFVPTTDNPTYEIYSQRPYLDEDGNVQYADYMQTFAKGNYYVCTFNTITDNNGASHNVMQWIAHIDSVVFSNGRLADGTKHIPIGSIVAPYWVVTEADVEVENEDGTKTVYDLGGLYKWDQSIWTKVASITDNTLSRAVSLVSQTSNAISMDITNAKGDFATLAAKILDSDIKIQTATNFLTGEYVTIENWDEDLADKFADPSTAYKTELIYYNKENGLYYYYVNDEGWKSTNNSFEAGLKGNLSIIDQSANKDGSEMALVVSGLHGEQVLKGASIVLAQDGSGSYIHIDADNISLVGYVTLENLKNEGTTEIHGGNIITGTLRADKIEVKDNSSNAIIFKAEPNDVSIAGWTVSADKISQGNVGLYSGDSNYLTSIVDNNKTSPVRFYAGGDILNNAPFKVLNDGSLYASAAQITGNIIATSGFIGSSDRGWQISSGIIANYGTETITEGGKKYYTKAFGMQSPSNPGAINAIAIGGKMTPSSWADANFVVTVDGKLIARSGVIGGCEIKNDTLQISQSNITSIDASKIVTGAIESQNYESGKHGLKLDLNEGTVDITQGNIRIGGSMSQVGVDTEIFSQINQNGIMQGVALTYEDHSTYSSSVALNSGYISFEEDNNGNKIVASIHPFFNQDEDADPYKGYAFTADQNLKLQVNSGDASLRLSTYQGYLYGTWYYNSSGVATTSDEHIKHNIENLTDAYSILFDNLRPVRFKYNEGTSDRYHTGFIAQEIETATIKSGLSTQDFAAFVRNKEDGKEQCYVRYEEIIALCVDQIQKLKKQVIVLENKLDIQQNDCYLSNQ